MNKPGDIMQAVQLMLVQHETYRLKMATHGFGTPTSYEFKFKGDCVADKALVAEVSRIIRKTTNALIVCTNTPPDAEPLLPPNVPK